MRANDLIVRVFQTPRLPNRQISAEIDAPIATFAAIWIAVVGVIAYMFLPLVVGGLADEYGYSNRQLGFIGAAEAGGMGIANALAVFWMRRSNWRSIIFASALGMITANLASTTFTSFNTMFAIRLADGIAGGTLIAIGVACQSDNKRADRIFGYFIAMEMVVSAIGFVFLPSIVRQFGVDGVFYALAVLSFSGLACAFFHPRRGLNRNETMSNEGRGAASNLVSIVALIGALLFFMSQGGIWTFVERIGVASALDPQLIGNALSVSSLCGIGGALGAKKIADMIGQRNAFFLVLVGELICIAMLFGVVDPMKYFLAICLFIFFWSMGLPLMLVQFNKIDGSGHLVILLYAMGKLGYTLGPAIMGLLIIGGGFHYVLILGAMLSTAGLAVSIALQSKRFIRSATV